MNDRTRRPWVHLGLVSLAAATLLSTRVQAQQPGMWGRARDACSAAATRAGYVVLRRDRESLHGSMYAFPMHVRRGATEVDITCRYDGVSRLGGSARIREIGDGRGPFGNARPACPAPL